MASSAAVLQMATLANFHNDVTEGPGKPWSPTPWILAILAVFAVILLLCAPALRAFILNASLESELIAAQRPFNSREWKEWPKADKPDVLAEPSPRQKMIADLVTSRLEGLSKEGIEAILGVSATHEEMTRRPTAAEMPVVAEMRLDVTGHYYDEHGWDLLYGIGLMRQASASDLLAPDGDGEALLIRMGEDGLFESWYIIGDGWWSDVVGPEGEATYRSRR